MGSIRILKATGKLFFDFRYQGLRCREYTRLNDTASNKGRMKKILDRIETEIEKGEFDYGSYFPNSRMLEKFSGPSSAISAPAPLKRTTAAVQPGSPADEATPSFAEFTDLWIAENEVSWRRSYKKTVLDITEGKLKPVFGEKSVGHITKAEILAFRSALAKVPGRKGEGLSPKRINAIMGVARQILDEAADRYDFTSPYRNIKPLKVPRTDVEPFTLDEVQRILDTVRSDFRPYYSVRFFTGMRTGEIDGLKWRYVDFERRLILVRETVVAGEEDYTKNDHSQREIQMSQIVYDALREQERMTRPISAYVFCTRDGKPLDHNNVTKRVWYPLLRHLELKQRRPYQSRHTAATLWLAAGENPE